MRLLRLLVIVLSGCSKVPILDIEGQSCGVLQAVLVLDILRLSIICCICLSASHSRETDAVWQAINKMPTGVEIDETMPVGKSAVSFSLVDEWLVCK